MPRPEKYRDVIRFRRGRGWVLLRTAKGSHEIWGDPASGAKLSIPAHNGVSAGVIGQIVREFPDAPTEWR